MAGAEFRRPRTSLPSAQQGEREQREQERAPDRREAVVLESLDVVHAVGERIALGRRHLDGATGSVLSLSLPQRYSSIFSLVVLCS